MMRRWIGLLSLAVMALALGCVDYDERLELNKNGSGRVSMRMAVDEESFETMKEFAETFGEGDKGMMGGADEAKIRGVLEERNSKAKLEKYAEKTVGGDKVWEMEFSFKSLEDLADIGAALDDENEGEAPFSYEKQADGSWLFTRDLETDKDAAASWESGEQPEAGLSTVMGEDFDPANFDAEDFAKTMEKKMAEFQEMAEKMEKLQPHLEERQEAMEADSKKRMIRFSVLFPGKIVDSNATKVEGNRATWEYSMADLQGMKHEMPALSARIKH